MTRGPIKRCAPLAELYRHARPYYRGISGPSNKIPPERRPTATNEIIESLNQIFGNNIYLKKIYEAYGPTERLDKKERIRLRIMDYFDDDLNNWFEQCELWLSVDPRRRIT